MKEREPYDQNINRREQQFNVVMRDIISQILMGEFKYIGYRRITITDAEGKPKSVLFSPGFMVPYERGTDGED